MRRDYGLSDLWLAASDGRRARRDLSWTRRERLEILRAERALRRTRPALEPAFGTTDVGEPWAVLHDVDTDEVALHLARLDDQVWAALPDRDLTISAPTVREALARATPLIEPDESHAPDRDAAAARRSRFRVIRGDRAPGWMLAAFVGFALDAVGGRRRAEAAEKNEQSLDEKAQAILAEVKRRAALATQDAVEAAGLRATEGARGVEIAAAALVVNAALAATDAVAEEDEARPPTPDDADIQSLAPQTRTDARPTAADAIEAAESRGSVGDAAGSTVGVTPASALKTEGAESRAAPQTAAELKGRGPADLAEAAQTEAEPAMATTETELAHGGESLEGTAQATAAEAAHSARAHPDGEAAHTKVIAALSHKAADAPHLDPQLVYHHIDAAAQHADALLHLREAHLDSHELTQLLLLHHPGEDEKVVLVHVAADGGVKIAHADPEAATEAHDPSPTLQHWYLLRAAANATHDPLIETAAAEDQPGSDEPTADQGGEQVESQINSLEAQSGVDLDLARLTPIPAADLLGRLERTEASTEEEPAAEPQAADEYAWL